MNWFIKSAVCAVMPRTDTLPGAIDTGIDEFLVEFRRDTNFITWLGLVLGTFIFTVTPLFTVGLPLPSFWLPAEKLDRHADRITSTRLYTIRQAVFVLKMVAGMCWGMDPKVRAKFAMAPYPTDPRTFRTK